MIETAIEFSRYWFALLFGMVVAVSFAGIPRTRKLSGCGVLFLFCLYCRVICLFSWGMAFTVKIYLCFPIYRLLFLSLST